ncbi:MAG TPA: hypothetical protein VG225_05050 [Terracidiphilus sp.]|nr:hypothetical protein [Terracidiphilus sp.]
MKPPGDGGGMNFAGWVNCILRQSRTVVNKKMAEAEPEARSPAAPYGKADKNKTSSAPGDLQTANRRRHELEIVKSEGR